MDIILSLSILVLSIVALIAILDLHHDKQNLHRENKKIEVISDSIDNSNI